VDGLSASALSMAVSVAGAQLLLNPLCVPAASVPLSAGLSCSCLSFLACFVWAGADGYPT